MKVINLHTRTIHQQKVKVAELFRTLSSKNDRMLATDKWSPMLLDNGLNEGSKGGHGPIKYTVQDYNPDNYIQFQFTEPKGFNGFHQFEITELGTDVTEIKHSIVMNTTGLATLKWTLVIRWLHDAYIEDAFDKVENHFANDKKNSKWTMWVKFLRRILKPKK
ncbi:hypothetical protein FNW52_10435 [Flavobacterium sp. ZT3R18]|uniref:hypothetical protein n=1 Tax=Flavobacterium sp. ZT3R18 TaxID=2594429 RepID=UPI00117A091C|nr:hypothetical protein [Flavobacterium sp. ZT3R18]TRX35452.1 hypothetical protein FNW52_10435 [Flavobacterium sp. ZT3R18]